MLKNFLQTSCHCERVQRVKQSAQFSQSAYCLTTTAHAWQIASLAALVRNDTVVENKVFG